MSPIQHPLAWPEERRRTPARLRRRAPYGPPAGGFRRPWTFEEAAGRIARELRLLGSERWLISVERDPGAGNEALADPGVCLTFTFDGKIYRLAADRWDRQADNAHAIAGYLERQRAIARSGAGAVRHPGIDASRAVPQVTPRAFDEAPPRDRAPRVVGPLRRLLSRLSLLLVVTAALPISGCGVQYVRMADAGGIASDDLNDIVSYWVDPGAYSRDVNCALVMPTEVNGVQEAANVEALRRYIENTTAERASARLPRVIGPAERDRLARESYLDPETPDGISGLVQRLDCGYRIESELAETRSLYMVFWARNRIVLRVRLVRDSGDRIVWKASHVLSRSKGGIPLGPFGAAWDAVQATSFNRDDEQVVSMVDDAQRRLWATFPRYVSATRALR